MQVVVRAQLLMPNATFATSVVIFQGCVEQMRETIKQMIYGQFLQQGHWQQYPYLKPGANSRCSTSPATLFLAATPQGLGPPVLTAQLNNQTVDVLIDTGALKISFIKNLQTD